MSAVKCRPFVSPLDCLPGKQVCDIGLGFWIGLVLLGDFCCFLSGGQCTMKCEDLGVCCNFIVPVWAEQLSCVVLARKRFLVASYNFQNKLCGAKVYFYKMLLGRLHFCSCLGGMIKGKGVRMIYIWIFPVFSFQQKAQLLLVLSHWTESSRSSCYVPTLECCCNWLWSCPASPSICAGGQH